MMSFKQKLYECMAKYKYPVRIKTVVPITQVMYQLIQSHLYKYRPEYISEVNKTIFQKNPLHFGHIEGSEIWYIDAILTIPVSSYILAEELQMVLKIPEENIVVVTQYDASEQINNYVASIIDMEKKAKEEGLEKGSRLSVFPHYFDGETAIPGDTMAGQRYNEAFKKYLSTVAASRPDPVVKDEGNQPLFGWLWNKKDEPKYGEEDFNYSIKDAPRVYPKGSVKADDQEIERVKAVTSELQGKYSSFYSTKTTTSIFKNKDGNKIEFVSFPKSLQFLKNEKSEESKR